MIEEEVFVIFKKYIPTPLWPNIIKTAIEFKDNYFLKRIGATKKWYRNYYLKVTFKSQVVKKIRLSLEDKNVLKQNVKKFNQSLKTQQSINNHLKKESKF
jgi:hypothetical protein